MTLYATLAEIRAAKPTVAKIANSTDQDLTRWATLAKIHVDVYCEQNFEFEQQVTKRLIATVHPTIHAPKFMSNVTSVTVNAPGETAEDVDLDTNIEWDNDQYWLRYLPLDREDPSRSRVYLNVTADWGFPQTLAELIITAANDLRTKYEAHRVSTTFHNSADATNDVTAPVATTIGSAYTLLNDIADQLAAHALDDTAHEEAETLTMPADASTEATAQTLADALTTFFNDHADNTSVHLEADTDLVTVSVNNTVFPDKLKMAYYNIIQRIAVRDNADDLRYFNSGFDSEGWGDEYKYSLTDSTMRQTISPEDAMFLYEYVNQGVVVS